jgi:hypothetical protein
MSKIEELYDLYLDEGLLTKAVSLSDFKNADEDQRDQLYSLAKDNNLISEDIVDFTTFDTAWGEEDGLEKNTSEPGSGVLAYEPEKEQEVLETEVIPEYLKTKEEIEDISITLPEEKEKTTYEQYVAGEPVDIKKDAFDLQDEVKVYANRIGELTKYKPSIEEQNTWTKYKPSIEEQNTWTKEAEEDWQDNSELAIKQLKDRNKNLALENKVNITPELIKQTAIDISVNQKRKNKINRLESEVLEEFETKFGPDRTQDVQSMLESYWSISPFAPVFYAKGLLNNDKWGFVASQASKHFGTTEQKRYYNRRQDLYKQLDVNNKELESANRDLSSEYSASEDALAMIQNRLHVLSVEVNEKGFITEEQKAEKDQLINEGQKQINKQQDLANKMLGNINQISEFKDAKNLTLKTYDNLESFTSNFYSFLPGLISSIGTFTQEVSPVSMLKKAYGVDITTDEGLDKAFGEDDSVLKDIVGTVGDINATSGEVFAAGNNLTSGFRSQNAPVASISDIETPEELGAWALDVVSSQIGNTAMLIGTGPIGLISMGLGAAGDKMHEMNMEMAGVRDPENEDKYIVEPEEISAPAYYTTALLYGGVEFLSEKITQGILKGVGNNVSDIFGKLGKDAMNISLKNKSVWGQWVNRFLHSAKDANLEVIGESGVTLTNNFADKYILGKEEVSMLDGMDETLARSYLMNGVHQSPVLFSQVVGSFSSEAEYAKANKLTAKIIELSKERDRIQASGGDVSLIQSKINKAVEDNMKAINIVQQRTEDMSDEQVQGMIHIFREEHKIRNQIDDIYSSKKYSNELKSELINDQINKLKDLNSQRDRIIASATIEGDVSRSMKLSNQYRTENGILGDVEVVIAKNNKEGLRKGLEYIDASKDLTDDQKSEVKRQLQEKFKEIDAAEGSGEFNVNGIPFGDGIEVNGETVNIPMTFALSNENAGVVSHELGHMTLFKSFMENNPNAVKLVDDMVNWVGKNYKDLHQELLQIDETYKGESDTYIAEEKLAKLSEYMRRYDLKGDRTIYNKIFGRFQKINDGKNQIENGKDVFDMIGSFNNSFESGELTKK